MEPRSRQRDQRSRNNTILGCAKTANIPPDQTIMTCIAMGWPDFEFPANEVKSVREEN